ncbi:MAG: S-layer homology domain-containing protein [Clostridiales bacterium]|nr:S-layer homology domain-containing protein [Clostridiales bacterium]
MKKRILIIVTVLLLTTIAHARETGSTFESIFNGHWAQKHVEYDFYKNYFEEHISGLQSEFKLNNTINKEDFLEIFEKATKSKVDVLLVKEEMQKPLLRRTAVVWMMDAIEVEEESIMSGKDENKFIDLEELDNNEVEAILKARKIGLINGHSETIFAPNGKVTYAQAMVLLQRLSKSQYLRRELTPLDASNLVPFKTIGTITEHREQREGLQITEKDDVIIITVVQRFNTSGYQIEVSNIVKLADSKYGININIVRPNPNHMVLQVISFVRTTIEVDKNHVDSDYIFEVLNLPKGVER